MNRFFACILVVVGLLFCGACGPLHDDTRITTELGEDGYALFRARHDGGKRLAFLVELRDAPSGSYVLLHSRKPPASVGWFDLDLGLFSACKRYGEGATDRTLLDCVLPDGHGDLVDAVEVAEPVTLLPSRESSPSPASSTDRAATSPSRLTAILRHELSTTEASSDSARAATLEGYYAVMRIERDGTAVPISVEVRTIDGDSTYASPSVKRLE